MDKLDKLITFHQMEKIVNDPRVKELSFGEDAIHEILSKGIQIRNEYFWRMSDVKEWLKRAKGVIKT